MLARYLQASVCVEPSQRCTRIFQSVCQKNACSLSLLSSYFAGSNPAVRQKRIASGLDLSFGTQEDGTRKTPFVCENVFIQRFVIIQQREKRLGVSFGAMQKHALPENGYRVIPIGAKRVLSAPCRKYLSFQPLLLHE